jgi:ribosomal protein S18 acetylase RimI-like enzyme
MNAIHRPARRTDVPRLLYLMQAFYAEDGMLFHQEPAGRALLRLIEEPALGWVTVVEIDGEVIGYLAVTLGYSIEFHGQYGLIDEIYVVPPFRRHGIGTALIEELFRICRERQLVAVRLEVERVNTDAQRLYDRLQFDKHDRDLMTRRLE